jgi:hypothetical protein
MFKKAFILLVVLLIATTVSSARLVDPISKELVGNDYVGSVVPGSELELIFSKELGKFNSLELLETLPEYFDVRVEDYLESIKVFVLASPKTPLSTYEMELVLIGETEETISIYFIVEDNLLDVSLNNYSSETMVNSPANYEFSLINNSHGDIEFVLKPNLPDYWLVDSEQPGIYYKKVFVPRKSIVKETLTIVPRISGARSFNTKILFGNSEKEFSLLVNAQPTLGGKFGAVLNGFPFYSVSLTPSYYLTGLLTLLFN